MQKIVTFLLLLLQLVIPMSGLAQNGAPSAAGAKGLAMGNTGVAHTGVQSLFSNPAGLSQMDAAAVTVFGEQRFLLAELTILNAGIAVPTNKSGVFGLQIQQFGLEDYMEQKIGLAYARQLAGKFSLGAKIDVLNTRISEYGSQVALTFELGLQSALSKKLTLAAHVFSPLEVKVSEDYSIPSVLYIGMAYKSSDKLWMTVEAEKDIDHPVAVKAGLEYFATPVFSLRLGGGTEPTLVSFGLGFKKNNWVIDVASVYHQELGMMPGIGGWVGF
jgi:hypothetical protein